MEPILTDILCTRCGLCCDGSLFADVELAGRAEATKLEAMGLEIDDDEANHLLVLPCRALQGTRCSIYAHRPKCCRTFECHLLQSVRQGKVGVDRAVELIEETKGRIARVKTLLTELEPSPSRLPLAERCTEVLTEGPRSTPEAMQKHAELQAAMSGTEDLIRKTFLGEGAAQPARAQGDTRT